MALEILHSALVFLGRPARLEAAEIPAAGLRADFRCVEPVTTRLERAHHRPLPRGSGSQAERLCAAAIAMPTNRRWAPKFRLGYGASEESQWGKLVAPPNPFAPNRGRHLPTAEIQDKGKR